MRPEHTVSEMVGDVLDRQAETRAERTGQTLETAREQVASTAAGRQLEDLARGEYRGMMAAEWQARLPWRRAEERHYSWLESYMEWLEGKEARSQYHALLEEELASLRG